MNLKANLIKKIAKIHKFASLQWLMSSTKMIKKWVQFATQCYVGKKPDKNGHFPPLCDDLNEFSLECLEYVRINFD